jgi:hypothetical protein
MFLAELNAQIQVQNFDTIHRTRFSVPVVTNRIEEHLVEESMDQTNEFKDSPVRELEQTPTKGSKKSNKILKVRRSQSSGQKMRPDLSFKQLKKYSSSKNKEDMNI